MKKNDFRPISRFISEMIRDSVIVTMEGEEETVGLPKFSNSISFNDLQ